MRPPLRSLLLGADDDGDDGRPRPSWLLPLGTFAVVFAAYAIDVFAVSGGVAFVPTHAAYVAFAVCVVVGYLRAGVVLAWASAFGAFLGSYADHAFFGLSYRSRVEQLAYFLEPDGLVFYAIEGLVVAVIGFTVGYAILVGRRLLGGRTGPAGFE